MTGFGSEVLCLSHQGKGNPRLHQYVSREKDYSFAAFAASLEKKDYGIYNSRSNTKIFH